MIFHAILEHRQGTFSGWIGYVPGLTGAMSLGETKEQVLRDLPRAIRMGLDVSYAIGDPSALPVEVAKVEVPDRVAPEKP